MACSNGTEKKPGLGPFAGVDVVDVLCGVFGEDSLFCKGQKEETLPPIPFTFLFLDSFCADLPPFPTSFDPSDFKDGTWVAKLLDIAKAVVWPQYCQCKEPLPPDPPPDPPFNGGQCKKIYRVEGYMTATFDVGNGNTAVYPLQGSERDIWGPVQGAIVDEGYLKYVGTDPNSNDAYTILGGAAGGNAPFEAFLTKVVVADGTPDNCGNPPPPPQLPDEPDPLPPIPQPPPGLPNPPPKPPKPGPAGPPGKDGPTGPAGPPGKDAEPCVPCKDGLPGLDGKTGPAGAMGRQGFEGPQGAMGPRGFTGEPGQAGNDGVDGKDAQVKFIQVFVPTVQCVDYIATVTEKLIYVIEGTESSVLAQFEEAKKLAIMQCEIGPPISAIPDWWQVRLNAGIPQLVIVFGPTVNRNYHALSIPHPKNVVKRTNSPLEGYTKGPWQGMVICKDNSKFIVNAESAEIANYMCNQAINAIDPAFLEDSPRVHISERKGPAVQVETIYPKVMMYHATGQKQTIPEWRVMTV